MLTCNEKQDVEKEEGKKKKYNRMKARGGERREREERESLWYRSTVLLSETTLKDVIAKWVLVSLPKQQLIVQEEMASCCARGGWGWILGKIIHWKGCEALKQVAQGSSWVTMPEGI